MREKEYIITIGSANMDVAGYSHASLNYADSNPGKIKFTPGGVGRNIAHNLALLGKNSWLMTAVGNDFYGQSLLAQTNQSGVHVDNCLIVAGENTSSYLSLLDNTGEMLVAINDMSITEHISAAFLAQHLDFIRGPVSLWRIVILVNRRWPGYWITWGMYRCLLTRYRRGNASRSASVWPKFIPSNLIVLRRKLSAALRFQGAKMLRKSLPGSMRVACTVWYSAWGAMGSITVKKTVREAGRYR